MGLRGVGAGMCVVEGLGFEGLWFGFWALRVEKLGFGGLEIGFCGLGFVLAIWMLDMCLGFEY